MTVSPALVPALATSAMTAPVVVRTLGAYSGAQSWRLALLHDRDSHLLIWLTRGQARCDIDGRRHGCGAHNALFLPARTPFRFQPGAQAFGFVMELAPAQNLGWPGLPHHLRVMHAGAQADLTRIFEMMKAEAQAARSHADEALLAQARLASVWLRRNLDSAEIPPAPSAPERLARDYVRAVCARHRENPAVQDLAQDLDVTPAHLTRCLRETCDSAASELLDERILHAARSLLDLPQARMEAVARALTFPTPTAFSRFVASRTGMTPTLCRKIQIPARPPD